MKHLMLFSLLVLLLFPVGLAQALEITNYTDGTTIDYTVPLIRGTLENQDVTEITCENLSSQKSTRVLKGSAFHGKFKVLAELVPGENELVLKAGDEEKTLKITYQRNSNPLFVRMIYHTDSTGDTTFQTPIENDPQNFRGKFDTALKLMQTMTAEKLNDEGYGRKTFNLELDENGDVIVHVVRGKRTAAEYFQIQTEKGDGGWYDAIYREIARDYPMWNARNLVIPAYSRFDAETKTMRCHTALGGGGGLALFGSGNIFTWPDSLNDVVAAFENSTPIDTERFQDDSVGRTCFWGAAATTIGAALHEIGHTLDLPHNTDDRDVMIRGYDQWNRLFVMRDAPSGVNEDWLEYEGGDYVHWGIFSAPQLVLNPYLGDGEPPKHEPGKVRLEADHEKGLLIIHSDDGIQYLACETPERRFWCWKPEAGKDAPKDLALNMHEIFGLMRGKPRSFEFLVIDPNYNRETLGIEVHREKKK